MGGLAASGQCRLDHSRVNTCAAMFDTQKFICEIELRPAIWDIRSKSYSNRTEKTKAWEEICSDFIENFEALEKNEKNKEGR